MLLRLLCLCNRHRPLREDVAWTGFAYVGHCRTCGRSIQRIAPGRWRARKVADAAPISRDRPA